MKKVHVIGICGKGTSAVALLLQQKGYEITGSDSGVFEPIASTLAEHDINYKVGYSEKNIPQDVDMFILGSSAQLSIETNQEVKSAFQTGKPIKSFAEILQLLTENTNNIVITGSYGKSTCTALTAHILRFCKKDPSFFIGAEPKDFETSYLGAGPDFVLEGDEYPHDTTSLDAKFLFYNANTILLTSAAHDHTNKFPTIEDYLKPYQQLIASLPAEAVITAAVHHPHVLELIQNRNNVTTYGLKNADYTASNIIKGSTTSFDLCYRGEVVASLQTTMLGNHAIENIVGVSALLLENKLVKARELPEAVLHFKGVTKRLELHNSGKEILLYESFGSSYEKARADIQAVAEGFPDRKIIVLFEPHTFGWRNRGNLAWYDTIFSQVEKVIIYKPLSAGSATHDQLSLKEITSAINHKRECGMSVENKNDIIPALKQELQKDSIVLAMTSSNFDGILEDVIAFFNKNEPRKS